MKFSIVLLSVLLVLSCIYQVPSLAQDDDSGDSSGDSYQSGGGDYYSSNYGGGYTNRDRNQGEGPYGRDVYK